MTMHYHGTPISPRVKLYELAGKNFCVSYAQPQDVVICHQIGQSVMLDNGAFSFWKRDRAAVDWSAFYLWVRRWLDYQTSWAIIPDVIGGSEAANDHLISEWFARMGSFRQAAPVWHLHEALDRLDRLACGFDRVCFGSSAEYAVIGTDRWNERINDAFDRICAGTGRPRTWVHMLRGMSLVGSIYPFASIDSSDVGRNHNRPQNSPRRMADRWDARQCPALWARQPKQGRLDESSVVSV